MSPADRRVTLDLRVPQVDHPDPEGRQDLPVSLDLRVLPAAQVVTATTATLDRPDLRVQTAIPAQGVQTAIPAPEAMTATLGLRVLPGQTVAPAALATPDLRVQRAMLAHLAHPDQAADRGETPR